MTAVAMPYYPPGHHLRFRRTSSWNGQMVGIFDLDVASIPKGFMLTSGHAGRWAVVCLTHLEGMQIDRLTTARMLMPYSEEYCSGCP